MIYFDNAATTYPKPPAVVSAMSRALVKYGANPGRAGHAMSMETAEAVYSAREQCARFFGAEVENTVFTPGCTFALNMAIKGILTEGSHAVISDIEHNAVLRPLYSCAGKMNVSFSSARTGEDDEKNAAEFERLINKRTKAVICTMAGNVTGRKMPLKLIAEICRKHGICFIVDAAQGAGVIPLKLADGVNIICAAGHKGLYGPMGTGLMITDGAFRLSTIVEGGTGSLSKELKQPDFMPDRFESGTMNTAGTVALGAGVDFVASKGTDRIREHEMKLCEHFFGEMKKINGVTLYSKTFDERYAPVIPFNIGDLSSETAAGLLSDMGFALRGGFHCAYPAHIKMGTHERGAVRFSPSVFSTDNQVNALLKAVRKIASK